MSTARCPDPVPFEVLVDYWLDRQVPAGLEEHLFACDECSAGIEAVAELAEGVRRLGREGRLRGGIGPSILERLENDRLVIRRYRSAAGGHIHCTVGSDDDLVVLELTADFAGVERVDLEYRAEDGTPLERAAQLPVIRGRLVVWAEPGDAVRSFPTRMIVVCLLAVDPGGERLVGEYTLHHTAYRA